MGWQAHVDFGTDRVLGLNVHPSHQLVVATTAGGVTHGLRYKDSALVKEFSTQVLSFSVNPR
jgi:hypothetical protein